ncbi:MAG TPA: glycosyltransferase family 39 protein [Streptosporangiaceae bacterium]|nr:glycosyltransferase family 39 protein [Streptosporangiaceae bacterium]
MNTATPWQPDTTSAPLQEPARETARKAPRLGIALIATAAFAAEMAVSGRYGYVRDELYFLAAGHHPAVGYVDQPALTPLLARLTAGLTGNTVVGLRVLPALCLAALVVLAASMVRTAGGSRAATLLAALATAVCSEFVGAMHELTTTTPDFVIWGIVLLLVMRMLASRNPRYWMAIGLAAGVGGAAKWNIAFLMGALLIGFAVSADARGLLRSRYLLIGGIVFVALVVPDLIWQAAHGWPNMDVFRHLQHDALKNRLLYWPAQLLFTGPVLVPVWIGGMRWLLRDPAGREFRPLGVAALIVIALQFVLGGKPYYAGGIYTCLFAAGAIALTARPAWTARSSRRLAAAMTAGGLIAAPIAIPVLPARFLHAVPLQKINYDLAESIAWPREVALVAAEYRALPAWVRSRTAILAGNYGEAGALARYGGQFGLPQAYSGANSFWYWGPPPASATAAIAIGIKPDVLRAEFTHVTLVATFSNGLGVDDDEQGTKIYAVTGLKAPWSRSWTAFRHFG